MAGKITGLPPSTAIFSARPPACRAGRVIRTPAPASGASVEELACTAGNEILGQRRAERLRILQRGDRRRLRAAQDARAVAICQKPAQPQLAQPLDSVS